MRIRSSDNQALRRGAGDPARGSGRTTDARTPGVAARWRRLVRPILFAASLLCGTASVAADYATRNVGAWVVSASSDRLGCFLTRTYAGDRETTLQFGVDGDGDNRLTLLNADWSIGKKEQLMLNFRLSNAAFPRHRAVGIAAEGKRGFVTRFGVDFPDRLGASRFLRVDLDKTPVADLDLSGSGAAIAELRRCVALYRDPRAAGGTRGRSGTRIPVDPFAARNGAGSDTDR